LIFRGTFEHALDAKHRLTVPSVFRAPLDGPLVVAASPEIDAESPRCMAIWKPDEYERYTERTLAPLSPASPLARQLERFFFNYSFNAELDSANRLMIPPILMRYAGLDKDVVVAGSGKCVEVWDRVRYDGYTDGVLAKIPELTASLGDTT
jgi:MraZ protein